ncbi:MAG: TetR family transcriptional regulator [Deltaproteobacteria bacterium]|jgi:TetR/AcrR family transcriptional regulator, transcriptional repressor for nem operon|nr:TetR family transcriptional regulator [Deltaproteobacteria bacterium]
MKTDTKQKILETGAELIHLKGFNHTGLQEILNVAGVPKGSFYNYFKSKEDFGLQVIDHFAGYYSFMSRPILEDPALSPLQKIERLLEWFMDFFKSKDYAYGCPIGNLAQEMGDLSPVFRDRLMLAVNIMVDGYSELLAEAQKKGEIPQQLDAKETAYFLVSSWHGALLHMKAIKGPEPLENHKRFIFDHVLKL